MSTTHHTEQEQSPLENLLGSDRYASYQLRGKLSQRAARVYLEARRAFIIWSRKQTPENLRPYIKLLRRCQALQDAERRLAA